MFELIIEIGVIITFFLLLAHAVKNKKLMLITILLINAFILEEHAYLLYKQVTYGNFYLMLFNIPIWVILGWVIQLYVLIFLIGKLKNLKPNGKIALLGLIMLLIDIVLEPVAYVFNWWRWNSGEIYYINDLFAWVLFSLLVGYFFFSYKEKDITSLLKKSLILQISGILVGFIWFNLPNLIKMILFLIILFSLIIILFKEWHK